MDAQTQGCMAMIVLSLMVLAGAAVFGLAVKIFLWVIGA